MDSERAAYEEVYAYTMGRPGFILQHVVDAFAVQTATPESKPIGVFFGLVGLYLRVERQFSGRQVQLAHIELARRKRQWPAVSLPEKRGAITAGDVAAAPPGLERDRAIEDWCRSVWNACSGSRGVVVAVLQEYGIV